MKEMNETFNERYTDNIDNFVLIAKNSQSLITKTYRQPRELQRRKASWLLYCCDEPFHCSEPKINLRSDIAAFVGKSYQCGMGKDNLRGLFAEKLTKFGPAVIFIGINRVFEQRIDILYYRSRVA